MYTVKIGSTHFPVRGLITLFGSGLFLISLAIDFTYGKQKNVINECGVCGIYCVLFSGNLNTYIISYLRVDSPDTTYADWVYVSTVKPIVLGIFMTFSGEVSRRIGLRASLAIGGVIYW